jgi:hypothetical protein
MVARRFFSAGGRSRSNAPNIDAASARNSTARPISTIGLDSALPNTPPVVAAMRPSGVNSAAMPSTNTVESIAAFWRLSVLLAPNTLTVIAIIGYTHGVSDVAMPAPKISTNAYA